MLVAPDFSPTALASVKLLEVPGPSPNLGPRFEGPRAEGLEGLFPALIAEPALPQLIGCFRRKRFKRHTCSTEWRMLT